MEVAEKASGNRRKPRRGPKSYPITPFAQVLPLAQVIHDHGINGQMRRLMMFDQLGRKPDSGPSRQLVTDSAKYGLTLGGYQAEYLRLTDEGRYSVDPDASARKRKSMQFKSAVERVELFQQIYESVKNQRLPTLEVLADTISSIPQEDRMKCAEVFISNLRYLELIREMSGRETVIPIDVILEELPEDSLGPASVSAKVAGNGQGVLVSTDVSGAVANEPNTGTKYPEVHIDINIHIDSTATSEQIDMIFSSMARRLYGREVD